MSGGIITPSDRPKRQDGKAAGVVAKSAGSSRIGIGKARRKKAGTARAKAKGLTKATARKAAKEA